mmetsp:Transcript_14870/g.34196  ORF Transcript_14870/g.34196 Transcript_14870/m.34196 type:complete len:212 (+) Transcript_14870:765-1400(+)
MQKSRSPNSERHAAAVFHNTMRPSECLVSLNILRTRKTRTSLVPPIPLVSSKKYMTNDGRIAITSKMLSKSFMKAILFSLRKNLSRNSIKKYITNEKSICRTTFMLIGLDWTSGKVSMHTKQTDDTISTRDRKESSQALSEDDGSSNIVQTFRRNPFLGFPGRSTMESVSYRASISFMPGISALCIEKCCSSFIHVSGAKWGGRRGKTPSL